MIDPVDHVISRSLLAGVVVGIGGYLYLLNHDHIIGSALASICFLSCSVLNLNLFTNKSGFLSDLMDFRRLILVLILNVIAAFLFGLISRFLNQSIVSIADKMVLSHLSSDYFICIMMSLITGFLITLSTKFDNLRSGYLLHVAYVFSFLAIGGFHCVLDSFYYGASSVFYDNIWGLTSRLLVVILFNFIGCNLYNLFVNKSFIEQRNI